MRKDIVANADLFLKPANVAWSTSGTGATDVPGVAKKAIAVRVRHATWRQTNARASVQRKKSVIMAFVRASVKYIRIMWPVISA